MKKTHRPSLRQLIAGETRAAQCPDEMMLAAWLEGRLSESQAEQVEAWLCHDPASRQALIGEKIAPQPLLPAELTRAASLVQFSESERVSWFDRLFSPLPAWGMACVIVVVGFWLGSGLGTVADKDAQLLSAILTGLPL